MSDFIFQFYALICEMSPYLLLGFFLAGILHGFVPQNIYSRYLSGNNLKSVVLAALFGVPLPLCSCGVIPTAMSMKWAGASRGATVSFLISTPQTGIDSITATYSLMGGPFAIIRPIAAFITGIFGGLFAGAINKNEKISIDENNATSSLRKNFVGKVTESLKYGFHDMIRDIGKNLIIGLLIGSAIAIFIPDNFFSLYANHKIWNMFLVLLIAIPMYVCATGSIPIAAALMFKGLSPGAALVFLMAGPAVNMASIMVINKVLGRKTLLVYIGSIVAGALGFGFIIDYLLPMQWFILPPEEIKHMCHIDTAIPLWQQLAAWALIAMIVVAFLPGIKKHEHKITMGKIFKVKGMTCSHCKANVEKAIRSLEGVSSVNIDIDKGTAEVLGDVDPDQVIDAVKNAGYECKLSS